MAAQVLNERYRLAAIIGEGGMATVYKAMDLRLERWVAVKVLRPQGGLAADEANAFLEEARTIAKINHPNILALYDAGVSEGRPFLVMELLLGPTLRQRLRAGPLEIEEAIRIAAEVAAALEAAHAQGVLHRDVKPENILFGDAGEAKLADFGISGRLGDSALQEDGTLLGTPPYLAPEYLAGKRLDARADVYALGVVLYEMLTGQQPDGAHPLPPVSLRPTIPNWLNQAVLTALAADPAARVKSPLEFAASMKGPVALGGMDAAEGMVRLIPAEAPTDVVPSVAAAGTLWRQRFARGFLPLLLPVILGVALVGTLGTGQESPDSDAAASSREQEVLDVFTPSQTATATGTAQAIPVAIPTVTPQLDASPSPAAVLEVVAPTPTPTTTNTPVIPTPTSTHTPIPPTSTATSTPVVVLPVQEDRDEDDDDEDDEKEEERRERAAERAREKREREAEREREERERERDEGGRRGPNRGRDG